MDIENENGKRIVDFKNNNLHVINYSESVKKTLQASELKRKLYSLPNQPNAIPYVTSYYSKTWGFCVSHNFKKKLKKGKYKVFIDSKHFKGSFVHRIMKLC